MPSGTSVGAMLRASVSTTSRYPAPTAAETGSSRPKPGPASIRPTCGITRPTQPITPATAVTLAVTRVAAAMVHRRSRPA